MLRQVQVAFPWTRCSELKRARQEGEEGMPLEMPLVPLELTSCCGRERERERELRRKCQARHDAINFNTRGRAIHSSRWQNLNGVGQERVFSPRRALKNSSSSRAPSLRTLTCITGRTWHTCVAYNMLPSVSRNPALCLHSLDTCVLECELCRFAHTYIHLRNSTQRYSRAVVSGTVV